MSFTHTKVLVANAFLLISKKRKPIVLTRRNRKISAGLTQTVCQPTEILSQNDLWKL